MDDPVTVKMKVVLRQWIHKMMLKVTTLRTEVIGEKKKKTRLMRLFEPAAPADQGRLRDSQVKSVVASHE